MAMDEQELTVLLGEWANGSQEALARLTPLVYPQLRQIASACLGWSRGSGTLQATSLVSELYLKLLRDPPAQIEGRRHFYALAARIMRLAVVDHYRERAAQKRASSATRVPFHEEISWVDANGPEVLDFSRALDELAELDKLQAELLELRFVLCCTADEVAALTGLSKSTVDRKVRIGRAWLFRRLQAGPDANSE